MSINANVERAKEDYDRAYEAGKQSAYDEFWDTFQMNGTREHYVTAFSYATTGNGGWTDNTYNPKYPIKGRTYGLQEVFRNNSMITDTKVPLRLLSNNLKTTFYYCSSLKRVPLLSLEVAVTEISGPFLNCYALEDLNIECVGDGCIAGNGFNVQWSTKLTHDSLMSIINALQDKSGDTSGTTWTVTLGDTNIAKLTDEELNIAYRKGWTIA